MAIGQEVIQGSASRPGLSCPRLSRAAPCWTGLTCCLCSLPTQLHPDRGGQAAFNPRPFAWVAAPPLPEDAFLFCQICSLFFKIRLLPLAPQCSGKRCGTPRWGCFHVAPRSAPAPSSLASARIFLFAGSLVNYVDFQTEPCGVVANAGGSAVCPVPAGPAPFCPTVAWWTPEGHRRARSSAPRTPRPRMHRWKAAAVASVLCSSVLSLWMYRDGLFLSHRLGPALAPLRRPPRTLDARIARLAQCKPLTLLGPTHKGTHTSTHTHRCHHQHKLPQPPGWPARWNFWQWIGEGGGWGEEVSRKLFLDGISRRSQMPPQEPGRGGRMSECWEPRSRSAELSQKITVPALRGQGPEGD